MSTRDAQEAKEFELLVGIGTQTADQIGGGEHANKNPNHGGKLAVFQSLEEVEEAAFEAASWWK